MSTVTLATRSYTPLAFRGATERWLVATLCTVVAVTWCFVIPLEILLHGSGARPAAQIATSAP